MPRILQPEPLTRTEFAPFGQVIETTGASGGSMNDGRFERFGALATVDMEPPGQASIDVVRCLQPTSLPFEFDLVERHPLGSQAFIPMSGFVFIVVVAARGETVDADGIRAFATNGHQGINYHRGTWHMPMIATAEGQSFMIIERGGDEVNCEQRRLPEPMLLVNRPVLV